MALVDYSDSESDSEAPRVKETPRAAPSAKAAFQKAAPGKIKVELPSFKPEPGQTDNTASEGPPAKRARTAGAFSGFNSLLPAPKRTAQSAPKAGVNLKTSSEAAFSRNPPPQPADEQEYDGAQLIGDEAAEEKKKKKVVPPPDEPKLVGKATRFLPLSVSNKKKKKATTKPLPVPEPVRSNTQQDNIEQAITDKIKKDVEAIPKPKRSLFAVQPEEALPTPVKDTPLGVYEPIMVQEEQSFLPTQIEPSAVAHHSAPANPNSLEATAADLNLTPAQRRQLFGRNGGKDANVMHFNLDNEYAANEQARQAGEVVEHRAIKAIAPGKHSLQQLVNNARTQQDAMEDKWAEGRRNRGEGGSKYGWS